MKKYLTKNVRMSIIGLLATLALICVVSVPSDDASWIVMMIISKGIAAVFAFLAYILFRRWNAKGMLPNIEE